MKPMSSEAEAKRIEKASPDMTEHLNAKNYRYVGDEDFGLYYYVTSLE